VSLGDARDANRGMRVSWHPDRQTIVFSHWNGAVCVASTPIDMGDADRLVDLLMSALRHAAAHTGAPAGHTPAAAGPTTASGR
jgi:hypothetical protein